MPPDLQSRSHEFALIMRNGMLIAGRLLQSRKYFLQHQHGDYSHNKSRAKEPFRTTLYKLELRFLFGCERMGLL